MNFDRRQHLFFLSIYLSIYLYIYQSILLASWLASKENILIYLSIDQGFLSVSLSANYFHSPVDWGCKIHRLCLNKGVGSPPNECLGYDTKLHLMERIQSWSFRESGVPLPLLPLLPGLLCPGVVVPVMVLSMGLIELFNHSLYLKPFNRAQTKELWFI